MLTKKYSFYELEFLLNDKSNPPITENFYQYFLQFNLVRVLVVTDEDINTDLRVINQITALSRITKEITLVEIKPDNYYCDSQKKSVLTKLHLLALYHCLWFPWFLMLVLINHPKLRLSTKAKQGIVNDHSYLLSKKIPTKGYTCVICNNLISISNIDIHNNIDYIYDIHELEVFRNRNTASVQRAYYIYLNEMKRVRNTQNLITISNFNAKKLSRMYFIDRSRIKCIYNQNFCQKVVATNFIKDEPLLIYIGSVSLDRGLKDITKLSFKYNILVIACNYKVEAIAYLENNCDNNHLTIFKGMDYQDLLISKIKEYRYPFFLILISPTHPSYRYALPNKFFQAQAIGCPIIAYNNTYLGNIINKYGCGLLYTQSSNKGFEIKISESQYLSMQKSMLNNLEKAIDNQQL